VKLSVREKVGYAFGDVATNFFFQSMILYQNRFYTDTVGLSPGVISVMFLVVRLGDAFFDPIIGALSDRTKTRWGKFRPWVLWTAIPFGACFWLVYVVPNVGPQGKLVYAYVTYVLLMILYSANNTPYSALMGVMTPDTSERSNIARYRFVAAIFGQFVIQSMALPLVDKFGAGNDAKGWGITMGIFGAIMVVCNLIVFSTTALTLQGAVGSSEPLLKPNIAFTMPEPCSTTVLMRSVRVRIFCGLSTLSSMICAEPLTMERMLLKSCAMPAARVPSAFIF